MPLIADYCLDALIEKVREATRLFLNSSEPATYTAASSTAKLGTKTTPTMGAVSDRSPNGRKTTVASFTDGAVETSGTASHWSLGDHVNSRLLSAGALAASQSVTISNTFSVAAFDVGVPDAA